MALFKCKMCGGSLNTAAGETIVECEYCGTQQTLPKTTDENIQALFNRANLLRQKNEFDKSEEIYEKILEADNTEAEAYWGVILCKFGIEYVEDPKTYKRIPTCHRTSYDSIVADEYYKKAIEHADATQRVIYEAEAKKIDEIQKGILAISAQEEPFDVFICYKQSDASGKRTQDSVIANDIYHQLTQEGFKVFYSAITLEDKIGSAYEPIIFAALNSAKVMLAIGTRPEYFTAVWVKNEWSRFLKMMKNDRSKMLIPCYKDMDAYELPEEFAHLQAQDMGKIGFINDVVRGIKKVVVKDEPQATVVKETVVTNAPAGIAPLIKRVFMFLEDSKWPEANEYCEKVLDIDPECADAYLGKLMAELRVKKREELKNLDEPFDKNYNYQKVIRFADDKLREELDGYITSIKDERERKRLQSIYDDAKSKLRFNTQASFLQAATLFESISSYLDSQKLSVECRERAEARRKNDIYNNALSEVGNVSVASFEKAIELFKSISGWRDADEKIARCEAKLPELRDKEEKERIEAEKQAKREKRIQKITLLSVAVIIIFMIIMIFVIGKNRDNKVASLMEEAKQYYLDGDAAKAAELLADNSIYNDIQNAYKCVAKGDYITAVNYGLCDIVIPNGVTTIYDNAFKNCFSLTSVVIPDSVTSIGSAAFWNCSSLTSVVIPDSVTSIGNDAFCGCNRLTSVVIGDSVTTIGYSAFQNCYSLTSVVIGDSVTSIGDDAFRGCSNLTSVVIGDSVTSIGNDAFRGCSNLTSVVIGDSVTSIGDDAFFSCSSLTSVVIGNNVTSIGRSAFQNCTSLTSVVIPDSVTSIGNYAFNSCSSLTDVYYTGSTAEWKAITIGMYNSYLKDATIHYNYIPEN